MKDYETIFEKKNDIVRAPEDGDHDNMQARITV